MLTITSKPLGVMDAGYARDRAVRPHLAFRFRTRAEVVVQAVRRYGDTTYVRLLDIGAAEGRTLSEMATSIGPGEYVGIEYDDALRAAHRALPSDVRIIVGDALSLPQELADGTFDVVSMLAVLEHLSDPSTALCEAHRMLRAGGLLIATCPDPFWDRVAERCRLASAAHHVTRIDLPRLRELVESVGLVVLEAHRFMWAPIALLPYVKVPVSPRAALTTDAFVDKVPVLRRLCVNAYVIARRTAVVLGTEENGNRRSQVMPASLAKGFPPC